VVRFVDGKRQLEFPLGQKLFETAGVISTPRLSPDGDRVAFVEYSLAAPHQLLVADRKGAVQRLDATGYIDGIAWARDGQEVWFTEGNSIWASPLSGGRRLVYRGVSPMRLDDISPDGKLLVNVVDLRRETVFVPPDPQPQRELPWLDFTSLDALSADGREVLFTSFPGVTPLTYVRATDGSSPVKLGEGWALAFSTDGQWALSGHRGEDTLSLLPLGVGVPKKVSVGGLDVLIVRWLRDGRLVTTAPGKSDHVWRLYAVPSGGGTATLVSDAPVLPPYLEVSVDGQFAAASSLNGILTVFPLNGSPPIPLPELGKYATPAGWTSDGQLWASDNLRTVRGAASHLLRFDLGSRRVVEERIVSPPDVTGVAAIGRICITPDSRAFAYEYFRLLGYLYVLDGLAPPRR
jgi:eukaryotic-like serine/threonine-protein kinase